MEVTRMAEPITEEHIQDLLKLRAAAIRRAPNPAIALNIAEVLGAYGLARSDGLGGLEITEKGGHLLTDQFLFCAQAGCYGELRRKNVVAPMYLGGTIEKDSKGERQFIACSVCGMRNVLEPFGLKRGTFKVIAVVPPPEPGPLSSH
jgi:hypothetical protein